MYDMKLLFCFLDRVRFSLFCYKFDMKAFYVWFFVGILFSCSKFSDCMILITQLFLKALKLVVMIISQSFFDSNGNYCSLSLNKFFVFR